MFRAPGRRRDPPECGSCHGPAPANNIVRGPAPPNETPPPSPAQVRGWLPPSPPLRQEKQFFPPPRNSPLCPQGAHICPAVPQGIILKPVRAPTKGHPPKRSPQVPGANPSLVPLGPQFVPPF